MRFDPLDIIPVLRMIELEKFGNGFGIAPTIRISKTMFGHVLKFYFFNCYILKDVIIAWLDRGMQSDLIIHQTIMHC